MRKDTEEYLTSEHIALIAKVVQNIDMRLEYLYNQKLESQTEIEHNNVTYRLPSESEVSEAVEKFVMHFPVQLSVWNGNGYRMLLTLIHGALKTIHRSDLAEILMHAKETEEYVNGNHE